VLLNQGIIATCSTLCCTGCTAGAECSLPHTIHGCARSIVGTANTAEHTRCSLSTSQLGGHPRRWVKKPNNVTVTSHVPGADSSSIRHTSSNIQLHHHRDDASSSCKCCSTEGAASDARAQRGHNQLAHCQLLSSCHINTTTNRHNNTQLTAQLVSAHPAICTH
jgi:hypothetical protein